MTDKNFEEFTKKFEEFFARDRAAMVALRTVIQSWLLSSAAKSDNPQKWIAEIENGALSALISPKSADEETMRMLDLYRKEVVSVFEEIGFSQSPNDRH